MITLPTLFGNSAYASLFTTLVVLSLGALANYAETRAAERARREGVLPPDPAHDVVGDDLPTLVANPVCGDALN